MFDRCLQQALWFLSSSLTTPSLFWYFHTKPDLKFSLNLLHLNSISPRCPIITQNTFGRTAENTIELWVRRLWARQRVLWLQWFCVPPDGFHSPRRSSDVNWKHNKWSGVQVSGRACLEMICYYFCLRVGLRGLINPTWNCMKHLLTVSLWDICEQCWEHTDIRTVGTKQQFGCV